MRMNTLLPDADDLGGTFRTIGEAGPAYQVLKNSGEGPVRIVVVESGEELDYPVDHARQDPEAV